MTSSKKKKRKAIESDEENDADSEEGDKTSKDKGSIEICKVAQQQTI